MSGVAPVASLEPAAGASAAAHVAPTQAQQQTTQADLNSILGVVQTLQSHLQAQGQVISSQGQVISTLQQAAASSSSSSVPNFSNTDNLAAELHLRSSNPVPRPPQLASDGVIPCLFNLSNHAGARRVKAVLGNQATFEVETLACGTSFLYDELVALEELAAAVKLMPATGPEQTYSAEHQHLVYRTQCLVDFHRGVYTLFNKRFNLLMAAAASPSNKNLLSALTARVRSSTITQTLSDPEVISAVQDLETVRADATFKAAARQEAGRSTYTNEPNRPWYQQPGLQRGRGRGRGFGRPPGRGGRGGRGEAPEAGLQQDLLH